MLINKYFEAIQSVISGIQKKDIEKISEVAAICADSIANGGVIHIHDTGHMLNSELINRAGGMVGLTRFEFNLNVTNPNSFRDKEGGKPDITSDLVAIALKSSNIKKGDVLFIGSVSGKSKRVVELALQAKKLGATVVSITSINYSSELQSEHDSGKRLFEAADIAIDNNAPYGDSMLEAEGLDVKVCPASGIAAACIMWSIIAGTVDNLLAKGITPTVYRSVNAPGGPEDVNARNEKYREKGY